MFGGPLSNSPSIEPIAVVEVRPADAAADVTAWRGLSGTVYPATIHPLAAMETYPREDTVALLVTRQTDGTHVLSVGPIEWPRIFLEIAVVTIALRPDEPLEVHVLDASLNEAERHAAATDLTPAA